MPDLGHRVTNVECAAHLWPVSLHENSLSFILSCYFCFVRGHSVLFLPLLKSFILILLILHFSIYLCLPAGIAFRFYIESHQLVLKVKDIDSQNIGTHLVSWSLVYIYIIHIYIYIMIVYYTIEIYLLLYIYIHIHILYINVVLNKYI